MTYPRNATPLGKPTAWVGVTLGCLVLAFPLSAQESRPRLTFRGHTGEVRCLALSPDGKTLASGGADNPIRFWDVASGKERATVKKAAYWADSLAFSPDGKLLASGTAGNKIKLWDVATRKSLTLLDKSSQFASPL